MIQFNLLPDVKLHYIKAERQKRLVMAVSTIITISCIALLVLLVLVVNVAQRKHIDDLGKDIDSTAQELQAVEDLDKILTVQSQLNAIGSLHDQKFVSKRLFDFLTQVTPSDTSISSVKVDYAANTIEIAGNAPTLRSVNRYADSLKFTTFTTQDVEGAPAAFANVVLTSVARQDVGATYVFTMSYDPNIFSNKADVKLTVPSITTRPDIARPEPLFQPSAGEAAAAPAEGTN